MQIVAVLYYGLYFSLFACQWENVVLKVLSSIYKNHDNINQSIFDKILIYEVVNSYSSEIYNIVQ